MIAAVVWPCEHTQLQYDRLFDEAELSRLDINTSLQSVRFCNINRQDIGPDSAFCGLSKAINVDERDQSDAAWLPIRDFPLASERSTRHNQWRRPGINIAGQLITAAFNSKFRPGPKEKTSSRYPLRCGHRDG